ncbi:MAG TPA: LptA/OstA family protein [Candidatus Cybelea sp.]|nr:LptA/OstA family protein [Candidatus Cybelea sp.]
MTRSLAVLLGALALVALAKPSSPPSAQPSTSASPPPPPPLRSSKLPNPKPSPGAAPAAFDLGVWTVHASSLDANFKTGDFSTPAKVVMTRTGGDVTADRANGNYKKQVLYLNGHVVMHDSQGSAGSLTGGDADTHQSSPSTLTADKAQIDGQAKLYTATGNVHYVQADTNVTADSGTLDDQAHTLLLQGAVHIVSGTRKLSAGKVLYNTTTGTAHAEKDVTMQFPGEFHRKLATPKPLKVPGPP